MEYDPTEYDPTGALTRLGEALVRWVERRNLGVILRDYLANAARASKFAPREVMIDYLAALYWTGRPGEPSVKLVESVIAANKGKLIPIKPEHLQPLLLEGILPKQWPKLVEEPTQQPGGVESDSVPPGPPSTVVTSADTSAPPLSVTGPQLQGEEAALVLFRAQKRAAQVEKVRSRQGTCGATDAVAICGLSPWRGPLEVYLDQVSDPEKIVARQESSDAAERMSDGTRLEPVVVQWWHEQHPNWEISGDGAKSYQHSLTPWMAASPDRIAFDGEGVPHLLEVKTSDAWPWPAVPDYYVAQVHWQHLVLGTHLRNLSMVAFIAARFGGGSYREYRLLVDPQRIDQMLKQVTAWWDRHVIAKVPPPVEGARDPDGSIQRLYESGDLDHLTATPAVEELIRDLVLWTHREELAEATKNAVRGRLGEVIKKHRGVIGAGHRVTWYNAAGKASVDWEALARSKGATDREIEAATKRGVTNRQWRISEIKGGDNGDTD